MLAISVESDEYVGHVVVDTIVGETSAGGVRIAEDLSLEEVQLLAHEMTLKFAYFGLHRGGAKMGIAMDATLSTNQKLRNLEQIGQKLSPIIRAGIYNPAMDMNCGPEELRAIYAGAGIRVGPPTDTSLFTALSVENALEACYEESGARGPWTLAIDGFGRVAGHLAKRLAADRFRIVALSTLCGAVRNQDGWDGGQLATQRASEGDQIVTRLRGEPIGIEDVLREPVDVLLPSSRTWVIKHPIVEEIQARMIVPVANAPYDEGASPSLHKRGVLCLPGFVTNAGGVFGSSLYDDCGMTEAEIAEATRRFYRPMVRKLLRRATTLNVSPVALATHVALRQLELRNGRNSSSGRIAKLARRAARRLPKRFLVLSALRKFADRMESVSRELDSALP